MKLNVSITCPGFRSDSDIDVDTVNMTHIESVARQIGGFYAELWGVKQVNLQVAMAGGKLLLDGPVYEEP